MQHVTMEHLSETREIQFHKGPFENEPFLMDDFAIVPAVHLNHAVVSVPNVKITDKRDSRICIQTFRSETCFEPEHYIMGSTSCIPTATVIEYPSHYCLTATVF